MKNINVAKMIYIIFCIFLFIWIIVDVVLYAYKKGTIDALTGRAEYELITHTDSTRTWESIR